MVSEIASLVLNKETGESAPLVAGSVSLIQGASPSSDYQIELRSCPPYENPDLILNGFVLGMKLDYPKQTAEYLQHGRWAPKQFFAGDIVFYPEGELPKWRSDQPHDLLAAFLDKVVIERAARALDEDATTPELVMQIGVRDKLISGCLSALRQEAEQGFLSGPLYGDSIVSTLGLHLVKNYSARRLSSEKQDGTLSSATMQLVIDYIKANYSKAITLEELAGIAHLSPYHFSRLFKLSTGRSPYNYLTQHRIECARDLMLRSALTLKQIALAVGFYDGGHLARVFRKYTGVEPADVMKERE